MTRVRRAGSLSRTRFRRRRRTKRAGRTEGRRVGRTEGSMAAISSAVLLAWSQRVSTALMLTSAVTSTPPAALNSPSFCKLLLLSSPFSSPTHHLPVSCPIFPSVPPTFVQYTSPLSSPLCPSLPPSAPLCPSLPPYYNIHYHVRVSLENLLPLLAPPCPALPLPAPPCPSLPLLTTYPRSNVTATNYDFAYHPPNTRPSLPLFATHPSPPPQQRHDQRLRHLLPRPRESERLWRAHWCRHQDRR
ncbi:unnamed protein product [Closterium sp. NIES-54]